MAKHNFNINHRYEREINDMIWEMIGAPLNKDVKTVPPELYEDKRREACSRLVMTHSRSDIRREGLKEMPAYIVPETYLTVQTLMRGLQDKNENVRNEAIAQTAALYLKLEENEMALCMYVLGQALDGAYDIPGVSGSAKEAVKQVDDLINHSKQIQVIEEKAQPFNYNLPIVSPN